MKGYYFVGIKFLKKNESIHNKCWFCEFSGDMNIYYIKKGKKGTYRHCYLWCECPKCKNVDYIFLEEDESNYSKCEHQHDVFERIQHYHEKERT